MPYFAPHCEITALTVPQNSAVLPELPPVEDPTTPWAHWTFGGGVASLTSPQGETLSPTTNLDIDYLPNSVFLAKDGVSNLQGLISTLPDGLQRTYMIVMKMPETYVSGFTFLVGNTIHTGGSGIRITESNGFRFSNTKNTQFTFTTDALNGGAVGSWVCLIFREDGANAKYGMIYGDKGVARSFQNLNTSTKTPLSRDIGLGNCHANFSNCNNQDLEFAEAVFWDRTLTVSECFEEMTKSRQRMARKGIFF